MMECDRKEVSEWIVKNFNYEWTIKNFSFIRGTKGTCVPSPKFTVMFGEDCTEWKLTLYPFGLANENEVTVYIMLLNTERGDVMRKFRFRFFNSIGKMIHKTPFSTTELMKKGEEIGWNKLLTRESLISSISNDDTLKILLDLKISHSDRKDTSSPISLINRQSIFNDLANLRKDQDYSDITLLVQGMEFQAHKAILAFRSSVFSSMFKLDMKEANSSKVEIEDIRPEVFEKFLDFIYTGEANVKEFAYELLAAADKYDIQDLKSLCEVALLKNITVHNCLTTLVLSDRHSAKALKEETIKFIVSTRRKISENELSEIKDSSLWLEILKAYMNQ